MVPDKIKLLKNILNNVIWLQLYVLPNKIKIYIWNISCLTF